MTALNCIAAAMGRMNHSSFCFRVENRRVKSPLPLSWLQMGSDIAFGNGVLDSPRKNAMEHGDRHKADGPEQLLMTQGEIWLNRDWVEDKRKQ